jgi:GR25 family glycosyltransferase involved in LPS biosynthesis
MALKAGVMLAAVLLGASAAVLVILPVKSMSGLSASRMSVVMRRAAGLHEQLQRTSRLVFKGSERTRNCSMEHLTQLPDGEYWKNATHYKQGMPKDPRWQTLSVEQLKEQLPVWVLSMKSATKRRQHVVKAMVAGGIINYTLVDAIDGRDPTALTEHEVQQYYAGGMLAAWRKGELWARTKIACDVGHYRMLHKIVQRESTAIIFEDDGGPVEHFWPKLLHVLQDLPCDWDILYLWGCLLEGGVPITDRVYGLRSAHCTLGYIPSVKFARRALQYRRKSSEMKNHPVDVQFARMAAGRLVQAYIAIPNLAAVGADLPSLMT